MINFAKLLGISPEEKRSGTLETALISTLKDFPDDRVSYITGLTGLLGKVAICDMHFCDREQAAIEEILTSHGGLQAAEARAVCTLLTEVTAELAGLEDFRYSRIINEALPTVSERREFLAVLFEVAGADGGITAKEDHELGQIANSLKLTRKDYIDVRLRFKEQLTLFQS